MKKKILFLIHDLGVGGAEKVLVNLVNNMDPDKFDITVVSLFGGGVNEQFLAPHIHYRSIWKRSIPGNSKWLKFFTPSQLHNYCVREHYDIEVSYLEGPAARIISGCEDPKTILFCWIHIEQHTKECASSSFRSYEESKLCYGRYNQIVCVSESVMHDFQNIYPDVQNITVRYNTVETNRILALKDEPVEEENFDANEFKLVAVGKISKRKGFDRLARIVKRLIDDGLPVHLYALGEGVDQTEIEKYLRENHLEDQCTFLGYQINPYKFVSRCDLFVCASLSEGFSTAATEALIVGTPVCTVKVSGMKELLGEHNEFGIITENSEDELYHGIKKIIGNKDLLAHYKKQAILRGKSFSTNSTVQAAEAILLQKANIDGEISNDS